MMKMTMNTLVEEDLPMQIDCTQWHPKKNNTLAVGAYQLQTGDSESRIGHVYIVELTEGVPGRFIIPLEQTTPGGVLDLKFHSTMDADYLAIASSTGLHIYNFVTEPSYQLNLISSVETDNLCLYVQWIGGEETQRLLFSDSEGFVNIADVGPDGQYFVSNKKKVHEALTWVCCYSHEQDMVYCGSDDGKFTAFELNSMNREESHFVKTFSVGVTSITTFQEIVAVGGYDDVLKIFELTTKTPKPNLTLKSQINLGGAIWRTQFLPHIHSIGGENKLIIAVGCARNGVKIVEYDRQANVFTVLFENLKYEGFLCYGLDVKMDWVSGRYKVATGYFDNKVLNVFECIS